MRFIVPIGDDSSGLNEGSDTTMAMTVARRTGDSLSAADVAYGFSAVCNGIGIFYIWSVNWQQLVGRVKIPLVVIHLTHVTYGIYVDHTGRSDALTLPRDIST